MSASGKLQRYLATSTAGENVMLSTIGNEGSTVGSSDLEVTSFARAGRKLWPGQLGSKIVVVCRTNGLRGARSYYYTDDYNKI